MAELTWQNIISLEYLPMLALENKESYLTRHVVFGIRAMNIIARLRFFVLTRHELINVSMSLFIFAVYRGGLFLKMQSVSFSTSYSKASVIRK